MTFTVQCKVLYAENKSSILRSTVPARVGSDPKIEFFFFFKKIVCSVSIILPQIRVVKKDNL